MESACAQLLTHVPRGWTNWQGLKGNSVYYNYSLSNNGVVEKHGDDYHADYLIDIVKNRSVAFMDEHLSDGTPIFVVASVPAAHEPADPAPQYANYGENLTAPRTPNYNLVIDDDARHWMIDQVNVDASPMNSTVISWVDHLYRRRLATLQSVDDLIDSFVECLDRHGQMDQTYMVYTADNGYHLGQFAVALDKRQPYETDVRVPFFARGPGILAGVVLTQGTMLNIDLAPTFLEFAGATYAEIEALGMDGEPMGWLLRGEEASPASIGGGAMEEDPTAREFLIEYFGENWDGCYAYLANSFPDGSFDKLDDGLDCGTRGANSFLTPPYWSGETWSSIQDTANNTYGCVRSINSTKDYQYCEWDSGEVEYFDVTEDEWQLHNLAPGMSPDLRAAYHAKLEKLRGCDGRAGCAAATKS
uniref:Sulfatase N-terminal domain-containing protein n=1 Tax=Octactis speculum TaxID=3111310 RepID=A0A7S2DDX7_9STRA|mmetsp:Transcript_47672/g.64914  ORF Transcript_47672/g.64914 Transcript_47672/m.64914 type:complete len:417 (+) Transcript_47672:3-1253(+)